MKRFCLAALLVVAVVLPLSVSTGAQANSQQIRWDIISLDFDAGTVSAGGHASALAADGSKITLTGTGMFRSNPGKSQSVTGGGTWETQSTAGSVTGSGTYDVTGFVSFVEAPGTAPPPTNLILGAENARAGLAVLQIAYSDGSEGVLVISCHLVGTPDSVFEGITASKGFVDYYDAVLPTPGVDDGRTLFSVVK